MTRSRVPYSHPPIAIGLPSDVWLAVGVFGLVAGALVLVLTGTISDRLVWLAENYRNGASPLSEERLSGLRQAVQVWGWSGIIAGSISLPIGHSFLRSRLLPLGSWLARRLIRPFVVDLDTGESVQAHYERSDVCQVPPAGVIGEAMVALVLIDAFLEKFGGDSINETRRNLEAYLNTVGPRKIYQ